MARGKELLNGKLLEYIFVKLNELRLVYSINALLKFTRVDQSRDNRWRNNDNLLIVMLIRAPSEWNDNSNAPPRTSTPTLNSPP